MFAADCITGQRSDSCRLDKKPWQSESLGLVAQILPVNHPNTAGCWTQLVLNHIRLLDLKYGEEKSSQLSAVKKKKVLFQKQAEQNSTGKQTAHIKRTALRSPYTNVDLWPPSSDPVSWRSAVTLWHRLQKYLVSTGLNLINERYLNGKTNLKQRVALQAWLFVTSQSPK